jgi:hypothetical protein
MVWSWIRMNWYSYDMIVNQLMMLYHIWWYFAIILTLMILLYQANSPEPSRRSLRINWELGGSWINAFTCFSFALFVPKWWYFAIILSYAMLESWVSNFIVRYVWIMVFHDHLMMPWNMVYMLWTMLSRLQCETCTRLQASGILTDHGILRCAVTLWSWYWVY